MRHKYLRTVPLAILKTDSIRAIALYAARIECMKLYSKIETLPLL